MGAGRGSTPLEGVLRWGPSRGGGARRGFLACLSCFLVGGVIAALPSFGALGKKEPTPAQTEWWGKFSKEVQPENLEREVRRLSSFSPRLAGYPGAEKTSE